MEGSVLCAEEAGCHMECRWSTLKNVQRYRGLELHYEIKGINNLGEKSPGLPARAEYRGRCESEECSLERWGNVFQHSGQESKSCTFWLGHQVEI